MKKEKRGEELIKEAEELGVATDGIINPGVNTPLPFKKIREGALQERIRRAKEIRYTRRMWIIALISAIASAISAVAAWLAVLE